MKNSGNTSLGKAAQATIEALSFLQGIWEKDSFELTFTSAKNGALFGIMREGKNGKTAYFEFFYFKETAGSLCVALWQTGSFLGEWNLVDIPQDGAGFVFENSAEKANRRI